MKQIYTILGRKFNLHMILVVHILLHFNNETFSRFLSKNNIYKYYSGHLQKQFHPTGRLGRPTHLEAGQPRNTQLLEVCRAMHPPISCFPPEETEKMKEQYRRLSNNQEVRQYL